ncbi:VIT1/CCC1 transporter family protein [Corynebacterium aquilae]|uniref:Membrane protein n=1 Tax=Corynebacterium aquilae DSM 44791 TaxID=1431546 RepID=A0A1L7CGT1_9CORY|nr:VIT family protein [Corynebacterium aquilae]APT85072.1 membrane protein [Corynebacterium aquilae DSM 44791]
MSTPTAAASTQPAQHPEEPHGQDLGHKLNWLRAGVLGANDGIVSVAALLMGVLAARADSTTVLITGLAATIAGAVSMALGEYVSVSAQRDTESALIAKEKHELATIPQQEHDELVGILASYGIENATAEKAVRDIERHDPLAAHLQLELGLDEEELTNPWVAAFASAISFTIGAALPMIAVLLSPQAQAMAVLVVATLGTLALTGFLSARLSGTSSSRSIARLVIGGAIGLAITYAAGVIFGA